MKAYIIESTKKIEPFGDHPHDCLIANVKLGKIQENILQKLDIDLKTVSSPALINDTQEYLTIEDSLFFTRKFLKEFIERSRIRKCRTVCAVKYGPFTDHSVVATQNVTRYPDRVEYGLCYMPPQKFRNESVYIIMKPEQFYERFPVPEHMVGGEKYDVPITDFAIIQIDHWANLWAANMSTLLAKIAGLRNASILRKLCLVLRARSLNKWKILRKTNKIGKKCDIHPTAYIEGSTIGDNVTIGAGTVIRLSVVGEGTNIGSNVNMEGSVVGEGCAIDSGSGLLGTVLYPGAATSASIIYVSILGRNTFVAEGVSLADFRFDGKPVSVIKDGKLVNTNVRGLGSCLGHGVYLGAGCVVAPGRSIPNKLRITPDEKRIIRTFYSDGTSPGYRKIDYS
jgi:NDP-sugar pyrophosphorylase family protein